MDRDSRLGELIFRSSLNDPPAPRRVPLTLVSAPECQSATDRGQCHQSRDPEVRRLKNELLTYDSYRWLTQNPPGASQGTGG